MVQVVRQLHEVVCIMICVLLASNDGVDVPPVLRERPALALPQHRAVDDLVSHVGVVDALPDCSVLSPHPSILVFHVLVSSRPVHMYWYILGVSLLCTSLSNILVY